MTKVASLGVTKMSVSRCFDEIEYLEIPILAMKGKSRVISMDGDQRTLGGNSTLILSEIRLSQPMRWQRI